MTNERHWPGSLRSEIWEVVRDSAIDKLIEETLGRPWNMQQNGDMHMNDSITWFEVFSDPEATALVEEWLASPIPQCVGRSEQPGFGESVCIYTDTILNELCNRGVLPEGDMRVYVSW